MCVLVLRPSSGYDDDLEGIDRIPSLTGSDGFRPQQPIRVHVSTGADPDLAVASPVMEDDPVSEELLQHSGAAKPVAVPPPAYGLWRNSVVCSLPFQFHAFAVAQYPLTLHF